MKGNIEAHYREGYAHAAISPPKCQKCMGKTMNVCSLCSYKKYWEERYAAGLVGNHWE